jgi:hypothetical protein
LTVSHLTRSRAQLWSDLLAELDGSGSYLTMSEEELIAAARNTYGGSISAKTTSRADLIASLVNAAGGSVSASTHSEAEMMAALANALGGSVSALSGSFNSNLAASVNAAAEGEGGGGAYTAQAAHFGGLGVRLSIESLSCTDAPVGGFSFWALVTAQDGFPSFWYVNPIDILVSQMGIDQIPADPITGFELSEADGSPYASIGPASVAASVWVHYLSAWDTDHATNEKIIKLFINGVDSSAVVDDFSAGAFIPAFNGQQFYLSDDTYGDALTWDVADFWFAPGQNLLTGGTISPATVAKFISGGKPVDLGEAGATPTGVAPAIFFKRDGAASTFATNRGTGGAFTLNGELTSASTSPSD